MKSLWLALAVAPLLATPAPAAQMVGAYQPMDVSAPEVQEARSAVEKAITGLRIDSVRAAYAQVVAGTNYKLVCLATDSSGQSTWEFVVWHRLDGSWQLNSAQRQ